MLYLEKNKIAAGLDRGVVVVHDRDENKTRSGLRRQAERLLRESASELETIQALSREEIRQLVHELRVHQIELELQNEELRQAQVESERLKDKYLNLYEFAPVGYLTVNSKGLILEANLTGTQLLATNKKDLLNRFLSGFTSQEDGDTFYLHLKRVVAAQSKQTCEITLTRGDGTQFVAQLETVPEKDGSGEPVLFRVILSDITDRKMAEEQRFRTIFEGAADPIFLKDKSSRYIQVNPAFEKFAGRPASEIIGKTHEDLFGGEGSDHIKDMELRARQGEIIEAEHTKILRGRATRVLATRAPLRESSGEIIGVLTLLHDISDRKGPEMSPPLSKGEYLSDAMRATLNQARTAAKSNSTILLTGESGSGKDYVARYIHEHSNRSMGPFLSINCAAIPSELAESELFGHEQGAFTGAVSRKRGLLELAEGGTILLNEIGDLPLLLQAKLLTFLDTRKFTRVGGEKEIGPDARLIAATNRRLSSDVESGRFRQDLFYRINVISVEVPPLRERSEDIPILVEEILAKLQVEMRFESPPTIDAAAMKLLQSYQWPGNVRELHNVLERAVIVSDEGAIDLTRLQLGIDKGTPNKQWSFLATFPYDGTLQDVIDELTKSLLLEAIKLCHGNKTKVARTLHISRDSLYRYLEKFGIETED